ncbi:hypothetical protein BDP27DRAFT_288585 [Rhodocollybia butyracea]|uniref:Protein kinase domain-containing protein n=1 Tax=Rhodocollybia butyracea TaxID=206335 RepID=A0A9P5PW98_9AGAR|nr:hypothetical protein BDP27DRAFT_288585 [Rhodocollybia butyracea]
MSRPSRGEAAIAQLDQQLAEMGVQVSPPVKSESELWWTEHFGWLKDCGYLLRPRYRPGWKPSWRTGKDSYWNYEDGREPDDNTPHSMEAIRMSDSLVVGLKRRSSCGFRQSSDEESVATKERVAPLVSDYANPLSYCFYLLDVLQVPDDEDEQVLVLVSVREVMDPSFRTIGEVLEFLKEMIQVIQNMHRNNTAHRDCSMNNMAMNSISMYTRQWYPNILKKRYNWSGRAPYHSRTRRPPTYLLFSFGSSRQYDPSQPRPAEFAIRSGKSFSPEAQKNMPCDPFATDIFLLGNMMCTSFLKGDDEFAGIRGLEFLGPLIESMMADDPTKRPTMDEVASQFTAIVSKLPWWKLRARAAKKDELSSSKPFRAVYHILWTSSMVLMRKPAIPSPKP